MCSVTEREFKVICQRVTVGIHTRSDIEGLAGEIIRLRDGLDRIASAEWETYTKSPRPLEAVRLAIRSLLEG
jgi:hypothetical protein